MANARNPSEAEMRRLREEVKKLRAEIDFLKKVGPTIESAVRPTIARAVRDLARKAGLRAKYSVTYPVTYSVEVAKRV
jgi:hypothetical protein